MAKFKVSVSIPNVNYNLPEAATPWVSSVNVNANNGEEAVLIAYTKVGFKAWEKDLKKYKVEAI
jgi:hypothetical protein